MSKLQSQWEFGDLFAPPAPQAPARAAAAPAPAPVPSAPAPRRILSVTELTQAVRKLLEQQVGRVWVTGEVTNLRWQSSGHLYFSIKDANTQLNCVLFRGEARSFNRDQLRDGVGVNLYGELTVYEARGQYQLIVTAVELRGVGALQVAFEKLKQRLQAEGLFAPERKRPLPRFPWRVGIVTSPSGAALRDVLQAVRRRHPGLRLLLAPCRVQGQGAGDEVACAIRLLNEWAGRAEPDLDRRVDVILLTRGGGSLEDLWAFNEEVVARAIVESRIPVISAVGHEIDFTISDFVADFRAATPTAAAEIITEGYFASRQFVRQAGAELRQLARELLAVRCKELDALLQRRQRRHPRRWLQEQSQRLDDLQTGLVRCVRQGYRLRQNAVQALTHRLLRMKPGPAVAARRTALFQASRRLREQTLGKWHQIRQRVANAESRLRLLSPRHVLERGYSITLDAESGRIIRSAAEVRPGQRLCTQVNEGEIESTVQRASLPPAPSQGGVRPC